MVLTKVQQFMLFALGACYEELEERFSGKPVAMVMRKTEFIDLVHNAKIASKKDRAVYKNLESLEKQRLVSYENKALILTAKGKIAYEKIKADILPFVRVNKTITSDDILSYTHANQTRLR